MKNGKLEFFETWSRELAWIYGLILGDGCISKDDYRIGFSKNKDVVEKFEDILKIDHKNRFSDGCYHTYFDSKDVSGWFKNRGIFGKKSHTLPWPTDIPKEYMWDFIRGLIDTDGSFRFDDPKSRGKKGRLKFYLGYSSATKYFVERLKNFIECTTKVCTDIKHENGKVYTTYTIKMNFEKSLEVLDKVYNCHVHIRNEERYEKYIRAKKIWMSYQGTCKCGRKLHTETLCTKCLHAEKQKTKELFFCFCGKEAFSQKFRLCSAHYHQYRRSKYRSNQFGLETFIIEAEKEIIKNSQKHVPSSIYSGEKNLRKDYDRNIKSIMLKSDSFFIKDKIIKFDKEDVEKIKRYTWRFSANNLLFHRLRTTVTYLWRLILNDTKSHTVRFINDDWNDYRKENLKAIDKEEMCALANLKEVAGIRLFTKPNGYSRWQVSVYRNKKNHHVGYFDTKEEAIEARKAFILKLTKYSN
jgi:hypothetical protein